mmetsp:Transcript_33105/g.78235  ORF Transcript_33105/g.78235 Transcript_33105/m.78235 type:complete len:106 (-) Transcript_33105:177-494(-)
MVGDGLARIRRPGVAGFQSPLSQQPKGGFLQLSGGGGLANGRAKCLGLERAVAIGFLGSVQHKEQVGEAESELGGRAFQAQEEAQKRETVFHGGEIGGLIRTGNK